MTDTSMTHLFAEPADVLLVRDGRPFSAGDDHHATGPFPPPPSAVYGALRAAYLAHAGADFQKDDFGLRNGVATSLGSRTKTGTLALGGLTLARRTDGAVERLWPAPAFLLAKKKGDTSPGDTFVRLAPADLPAGAATNLPDDLRPLLPPPHPAATFYERAAGYLAEADFEALLRGETPTEESALIKPEKLFAREPRSHVSLRGKSDEAFTGTAVEGQLFTVDFVRMRAGAGLLLGVRDAPEGVAPPRMLRLGGESRATLLEPVEPKAPLSALREAVAGGGGKVVLVLTTPCPSADGWRPEAITSQGIRLADGRTLAGTLVGAAVGRHETVGGWDVAARRPKPARRAAPAGAAYFLDGVTDPAALFDALDGASLCLHDADRAQGFGLVRVGVWS